jgi:hypothetical protein
VTKYSNHILNLHRLTSNSSSTTNFQWLSPTDNWTELSCAPLYAVVFPFSWLSLSFKLAPIYSRDTDHAAQKTHVTFQNACLLVHCPAQGLTWTTQKTPLLLSLTNTRHEPQQKHSPPTVVWRHRVCKYVPSAHFIATVSERTTENTVPVLLTVCVMRALPNSVSIRHNIYESALSSVMLRGSTEIYTFLQYTT